MREKKFVLKILLISILMYITMPEVHTIGADQPSIAILMESPKVVTEDESVKLWTTAGSFIEQSNVVRLIMVDQSNIFWSTVPDAIKFSGRMNVDYMLYIAPRKEGKISSYEAKLIRPKESFVIETYKDSWRDEPAAMEKAMLRLASNTIYNSSGKITVNITIISKPQYADVYRDRDRLGNTGENGFRKTYWWDKGQYEIKVCKPMYKDHMETLEVETNPTDYQKEIILKRK